LIPKTTYEMLPYFYIAAGIAAALYIILTPSFRGSCYSRLPS
jgi:hypothetical protein